MVEKMEEKIKKLTATSKIYSEDLNKVKDEICKIIIGQEELIDNILIAIIASGHILIEGVPGLAKTELVKTIARVLDCKPCRLQFTPDMLPMDIMCSIKKNKKGEPELSHGPLIGMNFIHIDEINRAPPKVQSALIEPMEEPQLTFNGKPEDLEDVFIIIATQNHIETGGTFELPEALLDRFMFKLIIDYPSPENELKILDIQRRKNHLKAEKNIINNKKLEEIQSHCNDIFVSEKIKKYIIDIIRKTRSHKEKLKEPNEDNDSEEELVKLGASTRASMALRDAAKGRALLDGRGYVTPADIKSVAKDILRHRILLIYPGMETDKKVDEIITKILSVVKIP